LKQSLTPQQLREAVDDGTIAGLVAWRPISTDDTVFVPAGTIHAIGPGLVIAEIQQRSDATFRMFDHGRDRELHVERALAAAKSIPASAQSPPRQLDNGRTLLASNSHFVFERLELEPGSIWHLDATLETWILILSGTARAGVLDVVKGQAVFAEAIRVGLWAGKTGVVCLIAYTGRGGPNPQLLQRAGDQRVKASPRRPESAPGVPSIGARQ
jgi:mannose-6-phosphate isomerase